MIDLVPLSEKLETYLKIYILYIVLYELGISGNSLSKYKNKLHPVKSQNDSIQSVAHAQKQPRRTEDVRSEGMKRPGH